LRRNAIYPHDENGLPATELSRHGLRSGILFAGALLLSAALLAFLFNLKKEPQGTERYMAVGDFPPGHVWFNSSQPLSLYTELQGHVLVVLFCDFLRLSDVSAVERMHGLRDSMISSPILFVVVYEPTDQSLPTWRETVKNWGIDFPVIVDDDGEVRANFSVSSVPQMLLIDTHARILSRFSSDWQNADVEGLLGDLLAQGVASRSLAASPFRPDSGEYVPPGFSSRP
jgi:hypothetical protein